MKSPRRPPKAPCPARATADPIHDAASHVRATPPSRLAPHHTRASIALQQGVTVPAIGRLLGHTGPETTLKYTHPADAAAMEAAETVGAILGN